jgi:hypothetical protein
MLVDPTWPMCPVCLERYRRSADARFPTHLRDATEAERDEDWTLYAECEGSRRAQSV